MLSISPYKLEMYLRCPRQYKFEYIDKLKAQYHKDTPPLVIGSLIHATLNHYYRRLKKEERNLDKLREAFKEKFIDHHERKDPKYVVFNSDQQIINQWVEKAVKQLKNFIESDLASIEPFIAPEKNPKCPMPDKDIELTGKLDRVDKTTDGLQIVDYKTGKLWEEEPDPLQLNFYHLLLNYLYPNKKIVKKTYYYLDENKFIEVPIKENENEEMLTLIIDTVKKIKKEKEFLPKANQKCKLCDYQSICPLYKSDKEKDLLF